MRLRSTSGKRLYLNEREREAFREAAKQQYPAMRTLCLTLLETGCRLSEALNLCPEDIQVSEGLIAIRTLKKRNQYHVRELPVPHALAKDIYVHLASHIHPERRLWSVSRSTAWRWVKLVMSEAGVKGSQATPKGLRHGFGVAWIMTGLPVFTLKKLLGHTHLSTTMIYATVCGPEERILASKLWDEK